MVQSDCGIEAIIATLLIILHNNYSLLKLQKCKQESSFTMPMFKVIFKNDLCLKGGRALAACISRFKALKDVGNKTLTKLYNCMVTPVCDYFSALWGHASFQESEKLQNRAFRYFFGLGHELLSWQCRGRWAG